MQKYRYLIIVALIAFTACDIDRYPYDAILANKVANDPSKVGEATLGNYSVLKGDANGGGFANMLHQMGEYAGDNVSLSGTTTDNLFYTYNYNNLVTSSRTYSFWTSGYKAILGCNKIIENYKEGESTALDQLLGENYYMRAFVHFQLGNVFGRPYSQGTNNLSVPLKLLSDTNDMPERATVGEVYAQVLQDLLKAETLLTVSKGNSYVSKEVAQALLSRVYLYMGENTKAIEYADKVINSGRYTLLATDELKSYSVKNPDENKETIFCFKYVKESDYNHGWYTIGSLYANILGVGWGEMYASASLLDLMRQNPDDARFGWISPQYTLSNGEKVPAVYWVDSSYKYIFRNTYESGGNTYFKETENNVETEYQVQEETVSGKTLYYFTKNGVKTYVLKDYDMIKRGGYPKFFIMKCSLQEDTPQLWSPVVSRLAEMYLNKAEAYAKLGDTSNALANLNIIRNRAGISQYTAVSDFPSGKSLLDVVLDERRMELAFEGHRKFDVFRNNLTLNRRYPGTHLVGSNPFYEVAPTDNRVVEYIPQNQINAQPTLVQNP